MIFENPENLLDFISEKSLRVNCNSKETLAGDLFIALKGQRVDGHDFLEEAFKRGASYALIERKDKESDKAILVDDVYKTLVALAKLHRDKIKAPVVAITGSSGKTTTRDLLVRILNKKYKVGSNTRNFNSNLSIPITLLNLKTDLEVYVLEIGASELGDIAKKCSIINPNYGLVTNIGHMHLESFGSKENILKTKTELYIHLQKNGGMAFVNSSDKALLEVASSCELDIKKYNCKDSDDSIKLQCQNPFVVYECKKKSYPTNLFGKYQIENISAAAAIGTFFGVQEEAIHEAITSCTPKNLRSQKIFTNKNNSIILDAYNANLEGVISGLEAFDTIVSKRKVVVLGSLKELGSENEMFHKKIGKKLKQIPLSEVLLVGEDMKYAKAQFLSAIHFKNSDKITTYIKEQKYTNTTFFIKGARCWELEKVVEFL